MSTEPTYTAAEWARRIAGQRELKTKNCARCGTSFTAIKTRKYCSLVCRVADHRERKRAPASENSSKTGA